METIPTSSSDKKEENSINEKEKENEVSKKIITMKCSMIQPPLNTEAVIPPTQKRFSLGMKNFIVSDLNKSIITTLLSNINEENGLKKRKEKSMTYPKRRMYIKTDEEKINKININNLETIKSIKDSVVDRDTIKKQLEEHWNYQIILLDYNIIDFTSKLIFTYLIFKL